MKILKRILFLAVLIFTMNISIGTRVYAAEGKLIIALSDSNVSVGNRVNVTLSAVGSAGESAIADMEFSYDTNVFTFISCDADNYSGGAGGKVSVSGTKVVVTLEAIDNGSARVVVTGSNGRTRESGETLEAMVAAGATIQAGSGENTSGNTEGNSNQNPGDTSSESVKSNDNSLSALSLSAGELSPEFSYATTEYTAVVPHEITAVEVNVQTTAEKAEIESVTGNTDLQVGENTVTITVKAEDGAKALYTILLTREEAVQGSQGEFVEDTSDEDGASSEDAVLLEEYESRIALWEKEYTKLKEKYETYKSTSQKLIATLAFIIVVLFIVCVNLLLFKKNNKGNKVQKNIAEKSKKEKTITERNIAGKNKQEKTITERNIAEKNKQEKTITERNIVENNRKKVPVKSTNNREEWLDEEEYDVRTQEQKEKKPRRVKKSALKGDIEIIDFDDL